MMTTVGMTVPFVRVVRVSTSISIQNVLRPLSLLWCKAQIPQQPFYDSTSVSLWSVVGSLREGSWR